MPTLSCSTRPARIGTAIAGTCGNARSDCEWGASHRRRPEAGPGPHDSLYLFDRFLAQVRAAS